ncbi:MAG: hypothetical protein LDL24_08720 [Treponema sp.]|nr:hypothetical protein [Treponema sp.]
MNSDNIHRWLVLVPHRDSLGPIQELKRRLWHAGMGGVKLLPSLAFIAPVEEPAQPDHLKALARLIREKSKEQAAYIDGGTLDLFSLPGGLVALAFPLIPQISDTLFAASAHTYGKLAPYQGPSPLFILALHADSKTLGLAQKLQRDLPPFRFRQGAVANCAFTYTGGEDAAAIRIRWELGKPYWMAHHG